MAYRETVYPSVGAFLALGLLFPAVWLATTPINADAAWLIATGVLLVTLALAFGLSPHIRVENDTLTAGRIKVATRHLGDVQVQCDSERQKAMGVDLDARAQLSTSPWARCVLRVEVIDPHDPVPYLLLSTRRPEMLAAALGAHPQKAEV